ncbi:MAG: quinone oxidoreductase [Gammaproteobacteria bacterium]|nr:quinone oxidoreductase [Gammaproteobacteria bacterium]
MNQAIQIDEFGGPEQLKWREVPVPEASAGEVLVRHTAIGLNFIDTYHRSGLYPLELPAGLGTEAAGVVEAVGAGVDTLQPGDRVTWVGLPPGAYAQQRVYAAERLVRLPATVTDETAAAAMLKGLTAWYLLHRSYPVSAGDCVLVYAAAGGVGQILSQWGTSKDVRVIGVTGSPEKAAIAREQGCTDVVPADAPDFVGRVRELSGGGVAAVYDSVGRDTFMQSLDCLRPHGTMVSYGNATGPVDPFSPMELAKRGSLFLTRPTLFDFIRTRADLEHATGALFDALESGAVTINVNQTYALEDAAQAHRDLEARRTTGSTILIP